MANVFSTRAAALSLLSVVPAIFFLSTSPIQTQAQDAQPNLATFCTNLLSPYPEGGNTFVSEVSALVVASPTVASLIHSCACPQQSPTGFDVANAGQSVAIGSGLAQAVLSINEKNVEAAEAITSLIANSCSVPLKTAFVEGVGDQTTATNLSGEDNIVEGGAGSGPSSSSLSVGSSGNTTGGGAVSGSS